MRDGILARQWLGLGSIHGFSQSQGRDDERRTTNDERAPDEKWLLSSGARQTRNTK